MKDTEAIYTNGKWEFDEKVTDCFEDMLERSIPQYEVIRASVTNLARDVIDFSKKETVSILDIGCSDGIMLERLVSKFSDFEKIKFYGIDVSDPMITKAKHRLLDDVISHKVTIDKCDLRESYPDGMFDVITSVLSVQFTPIEHRQKILHNIYKSLSAKNGCLLMVEKVLGNTSELNQLFVKNYYDMKLQNGYSQEQIDRKRLSLEGVLVPVTNDWNVDLLKQDGFRQIDVFWRWMNFVGYIALK